MREKAKFVCFNFVQSQKSEIQICSNKHETCLVLTEHDVIVTLGWQDSRCLKEAMYQDHMCWAHMLNVLHERVLSNHSQQI